jgi:hypothetical protein
MPQNSYLKKRYDSEAPINQFRVLSTNVKGGFPRDRVRQENLDTEDDKFSLRLH